VRCTWRVVSTVVRSGKIQEADGAGVGKKEAGPINCISEFVSSNIRL